MSLYADSGHPIREDVAAIHTRHFEQSVTHVSGMDIEIAGDPGRIRTCDLRIRNPSLYPAELRGQATS